MFLLARVERNVMNLLEKTFKEIYSTSSCNTFLLLILQTYQTRGRKNWSVVGGILANCEKNFPQTVGVAGGGEWTVIECVIEYFGNYGSFLKQSVHLKPIQFEYKVWCANLPSRYLFDFEFTREAPAEKRTWLKILALVLG